ncbi:MAG: hypothetical protein JSU86_15885 [Phycisphaerales bacterium]|nr:MAG: hypothetical protein JSU86_15885 [Phycisphaerales bacterium]
MQAVKHGGLSGKARQVHCRNRASRLYQQQLIHEYLEPDAVGAGRHRYIPIRGRNEFLPSVGGTGVTTGRTRETQLELALTTAKKAGRGDRTADTARTIPRPKAEPAADRVIRFPRTARPGASPVLKLPEEFGRRERFTIGGFLIGCAMGSAAASLVLLVVHAAVG